MSILHSKLVIIICALLLISACTTQINDVPKNAEVSIDYSKINPKNYQVAFLIMDGVYNTELTAPYDVFHHTIFRDSIKPMSVFTVANTHQPITSFEGLNIIPDFNYLSDSLPTIDILVIPSAEHHLDSDLEDTVMLNFVKRVSHDAMFVTSHCDGAFILAKASLLNDVVCTTFPGDIPLMQSMFPHLDVRDSVLFVHDGKYITSAGGARSFEAALYLCELLYGTENANEIANGIVLDWPITHYPYLTVH